MEKRTPAWLEALGYAKRSIHFESYIIRDDDIGKQFGQVLAAKAQEGVRVRLIYDWLGAFLRNSRGFWDRLRRAGVEIRCFNPPRFDSPLGWLSRDHRKMIAVDDQILTLMISPAFRSPFSYTSRRHSSDLVASKQIGVRIPPDVLARATKIIR